MIANVPSVNVTTAIVRIAQLQVALARIVNVIALVEFRKDNFMDTKEIWNKYQEEFYFFILKRTRNGDCANDILQSSFLKIHKNLDKLKDPGKLKSWAFQIIRNEINDYLNRSIFDITDAKLQCLDEDLNPFTEVCCFDKFLSDLPKEYCDVMKLVYIDGKPQKEAAACMGISLANTKARIRRSKIMMIDRFKECCKYETNIDGKLVGQAKCTNCESPNL
ncbi:sigma-70 family RNA polymerase sigma factor [Zunongwangia profunda]|uniref:sigma-70 family RNA polymerase sigma factor n=2 Tax=Zunongwangia TaxID=417127 RepID=UPI0002D575D0|nr:sigma-70 family RNA polymerase sigma factor [Zunongwangia profunda]|tara:strand:- start:260 stop:919 length:660 start_codon:yes stop_codon:yes gene_type:complete